MDKDRIWKKFKQKEVFYCSYISSRVLKILKSLMAEVDGVYRADDIEHIHRMRVATRRIRSVLAVFDCCCKPKKLKKWRKEIRNITRRLGLARDLDVKAEFLSKVISDVDEKVPADYLIVHIGEMKDFGRLKKSGDPEHIKPGLEYVLLRIKQKRERIQPYVIEAMDEFLKSKVADEMKEFCDTLKEDVKNTGKEDVSLERYGLKEANKYIFLQVQELYKYQPFVIFPEKIKKHHDMRITSKKLRYTMELFDGLYPDEFKDLISKVKKLQSLLGDMHDCDVWLEYLPKFVLDERKKAYNFFGNGAFFEYIEPGINYLKNLQKGNRDKIYNEFVAFWNDNFERGFREDIGRLIEM